MNQTNFPIYWMPLPESQDLLSLIDQPISCEEDWIENLYLPWQIFYINYIDLKTTVIDNLWAQRLQAEWDKLHQFYLSKREEIQKAFQQTNNGSYDSFETISTDIYHLHQFLKLNYRGLLHLFMLHDRLYEKSTYDARSKSPYFKNYFWDDASRAVHELAINANQLLINNSYSPLDAYLKNVIQTSPSNQTDAKNCQTVAKKYWVHPSHLLELILLLSKETFFVENPIVCAGAKMQIKYPLDQQSGRKPIVSTVYLDTDLLEDYHHNLELIDTIQSSQANTTATLSRSRAFASDKAEVPKFYALEHKIHRVAQDAHEYCIDKRIQIEQKNLNDWIQGAYSIDEVLNDPFMEYSKEKQIVEGSSKNEMKQDYIQWEDEMRKTSRKPVLHVTQNRIVYASQGQSVFITIDTDITMMRMPQSEVSSSSSALPGATRFPYCVVQVHGELEEDSKLYHTLMRMVENRLLYATDHFSIYLHGVATLFADQVDRLPYWFGLPSELFEFNNNNWLDRHFSEISNASSTRPTSSRRSSSTLYHDRASSSATVSTIVTCFENDSESDDGTSSSSKQQHKTLSMPTFQLKHDMSLLRPTWYQKGNFRRSFDSVCSFDHPTSSRSDPANCRDCMIYVSHGNHDEQDEWADQQSRNNMHYNYQESRILSSFFYKIFWPSRLRSLEKEPLLGANRKRCYLSFYRAQDDLVPNHITKSMHALTTFLILIVFCLPLSVYFILKVN
ncbi:VTC domain-containing protein [Choanephora cucurbitarum]|nr:VTC domain-containing protein [Choanephora cucurbitarum]